MFKLMLCLRAVIALLIISSPAYSFTHTQDPAKEETNPPKIIQKDDKELESEIITRVEPVIPPVARWAKLHDRVIVQVLINERGDSVLSHNKKPAEAELELREALRLDPNDSIALNGLGYFLAERGEKLEEALEVTQRAVNAEPNNSAYLDSLGWVYFKMGKLEEAEHYLKQAIEGLYRSPAMYDHLGDVYERLGKKELAVDAWKKALSIATDVDERGKLEAKLKGETQKQ